MTDNTDTDGFLADLNDKIGRALASGDEAEKPLACPPPPGTCVLPTPIGRVVNAILVRAIQTETAEVRLVPGRDGVAVRFGVGKAATDPVLTLPLALQDAVTNRLKEMADIVAGPSVLQEGAVPVKVEGKMYEVLVTCLPAENGDEVTLRFTGQP